MLRTSRPSGNLSGAQQDYSTIQQDFQSQAAQSQSAHRHHHRHHGGGIDHGSSAVSQLFSELGSPLQSGNLSGAQQVYSTLQQDLLQFTQGSRSTSASALPATANSGSLSVNG